MRDWLAQRITAAIMAVYSLIVAAVVLTSTPLKLRRLAGAVRAGLDARRDAALRRRASPGTPGSACATSSWITSSTTACAWRCRSLTLLLLGAYLGWTIQILWR